MFEEKLYEISKEKEISRIESIRKALSSLGNIRDSILVGVSSLYLLGFVGWAFFAWGAQLGVSPPFQAQYFVAGLPLLAIIIAAAAVAIALQPQLIRKWPVFFSKQNQSAKVVLVIVLAILTLIAALLQYVFPDYSFGFARRPLWIVFAIGSVFLIGFLTLAVSLGTEGIEGVGYTIALYASVAILAFIPYIYLSLVLYPRIPQYFGGGKFRCAHIDLYRENFSQETLEALKADTADNSKVVRSKEVGLIFSSSDAIYVFLPQAHKEYKRFEIQRGDISAIEWCKAFNN